MAKFGAKFSNRARADRMQMDLARAGLLDVGKIPTFTTRAELAALLDLARKCPDNGVILEIGSYLGASTCYLAAGVLGRGVTIHCVDTWDNQTMPDMTVTDTFANYQRNVATVSSIIKTIRMPSTNLTAQLVRQPVDLAFLDADHSYHSTRLDFQKVQSWISQEGIIVFHDSCAFEGVSRVIGEILSTGKWRLAGHINNLTWIQRASWADRPDRSPGLGEIIPSDTAGA